VLPFRRVFVADSLSNNPCTRIYAVHDATSCGSSASLQLHVVLCRMYVKLGVPPAITGARHCQRFGSCRMLPSRKAIVLQSLGFCLITSLCKFSWVLCRNDVRHMLMKVPTSKKAGAFSWNLERCLSISTALRDTLTQGTRDYPHDAHSLLWRPVNVLVEAIIHRPLL
jgi:hypothetical protein